MRGDGDGDEHSFHKLIEFKKTFWSDFHSVLSSDHFMMWLLLCLFSANFARAETLLGHNLTPTSNTLHQGEITAGTYALAVGLNENVTVGTSPWLVWLYNMPALSVRYGLETEGFFTRVSVEQLFFKTFKYGYNMYQQQSSWTRITATRRFDGFYSLHGNLGLQYFWDDAVPFSMRPIPTNGTPITLSVSTLHELHFTDSFGAFFETGLLGVNYPNRYAHVGLSGFYKWSRGYVQIGISKTYPIGPEYISLNQFEIWENDQGEWRASVYRKSPAPIHPEVQFQLML